MKNIEILSTSILLFQIRDVFSRISSFNIHFSSRNGSDKIKRDLTFPLHARTQDVVHSFIILSISKGKRNHPFIGMLRNIINVKLTKKKNKY